MANCLVTTLKDAVTDESLLKLGEMRVKVLPNTGVSNISFNNSNALDLSIEGNGYFTNSTGTSNLGKTKHCNANIGGSRFNLYIKSTSGCNLVISNKYEVVVFSSNMTVLQADDLMGMKELLFMNNTVEGDIAPVGNLTSILDIQLRSTLKATGDISAFATLQNAYSVSVYQCRNVEGDISVFASLPAIKTISVGLTNVSGNLSSLASTTTIETLGVQESNVNGNLSSLSALSALKSLGIQRNANITGNISSLSTLTNLEEIYAEDSGITGDISSFGNLTKLKTLRVSNTALTGDTSSLANCTQLTTFIYTNTAITGTWPLT